MIPRIYINHYSDTEKNPIFGCSNIFLNELVLRAVSAIHEFADIKYNLIIVDNGSPEEAHDDMVNLLDEHGYEEEIIWVREKWHPVPVGQTAAINDFLASESEQMLFMSSDTKIAPKFLSYGFKNMTEECTPLHFAEPNLIHSGMNFNLYRSKEIWKAAIKSERTEAYTPEYVINYYEKHKISYVIDSWDEPAPISKFINQVPVPHNRIGSIFFANRWAIETCGTPDTSFNRTEEYQFYDQAREAGCRVRNLGYVYLPHIGSLYRHGVGSFGSVGRNYLPECALRGDRPKYELIA